MVFQRPRPLMSRTAQRLAPWSLSLFTVLAAQACADEPTPADPSATDGSSGTTGDSGTEPTSTGEVVDETGDTPTGVTFWQDVAPLLYDSCVTCHREGGVGPFPLATYEDAGPWAAAIAAAVQERTMPPWLVTDDGSCGDFRNSRWMSQEQIDTIVTWFEEGAVEGDPRDDLTVPPLPGLPDATEFHTPDFVPEIQGGDLAEFDEYRCFLIDPALPGDRFLTAYDVVPGNEAIVHHVLVMPVDPELEVEGGLTNAEVMAALDDESPEREGWPCFGEAGEGVETSGIPVVWAPGQGVVQFPEGTGLRFAAQEQLVVQVHYNLATASNIGMADQTTIQLKLEESVEREGVMLLPDPFLDSIFEGDPIELAPGEASVEYTWELPVQYLLAYEGLPSVDLYGVFPHMHEYGQAMRLEIEDPTGAECAAEVNHWDFNWQLQYFYEQPRTLTADDVLRVTCDFDTTRATEPVTPGWGTNNEMCLMGMYLVP